MGYGRGMGTLVAGVIFLIFGLVLASPILDAADTAGSATQIGSFSGTRSLNDLIPFVYYAVVLIAGVGMIGGGFISMRRAE